VSDHRRGARCQLCRKKIAVRPGAGGRKRALIVCKACEDKMQAEALLGEPYKSLRIGRKPR